MGEKRALSYTPDPDVSVRGPNYRSIGAVCWPGSNHSRAQQVEILARVLSRSIEYVEITPEEAAQEALTGGMDQVLVAANREINERLRADPDGAEIITDDVERVMGQKPASIESWCRRNAAAFA